MDASAEHDGISIINFTARQKEEIEIKRHEAKS